MGTLIIILGIIALGFLVMESQDTIIKNQKVINEKLDKLLKEQK